MTPREKSEVIRIFTLLKLISEKYSDGENFECELNLLGKDKDNILDHKGEYSNEKNHIFMDNMLLWLINDQEIFDLFKSIFKYYI